MLKFRFFPLYFCACLIFFSSFVKIDASEPIESKLSEYIKYSKEGPNLVGYIGINQKEEINQSTWIYVKSSLDLYKKIKPIFIILDLNTPGGELFSAEQISDALRDIDTNFDIPVVAFIDNWAFSAGALLAYSCRFIGITKDASMGAAEPVIPSATGEYTSASEKVNSAFRTDLANRAKFFDRNPLLAEGMVDKDVILVLRNHNIMKLDKEDQILPSDHVINNKGKLLTLNAEELVSYGVADFLILPTKLAPITSSESETGKWPANKELLFQHPFFKEIPNASIEAYQMDWKTAFFTFLAKPLVSSLLFLGLLIGFYVELSTGGFGLAAAVGAICLVLIILSSFSVQAASWLELVMIILGLLFIALEIFVVPGFGLPGILGIVLTIGGLFLMMLPAIGSFDFTMHSGELTIAGRLFLERLGWLSATLVVGIIVIAFLARFVMPKLSKFSRLVHSEDQAGYTSGGFPKDAIGKTVVVLTNLKPAGHILYDNKTWQAVSASGFIESGKNVKIIGGEYSHFIVTNVDTKE